MSLHLSSRSCLTALPLVLMLVLPSQAATINVTGLPGTDGAPGNPGTAGGDATIVHTSPDLSNTASATGGNGGTGGSDLIAGGAAGGKGGDALASVKSEGQDIFGQAIAAGGYGGATGEGGYGAPGATAGNGGAAIAQTNLTGSGSLTGWSTATGGSGGWDQGSGTIHTPGLGGTAKAETRAVLNGAATAVDLWASAQGGDGGGAYDPYYGQLETGRNGADVTQIDAVGLDAAGHQVDMVNLFQQAIGGAAGGMGGNGGRGGHASSSLTAVDQAVTQSTMWVNAVGGAGAAPHSYNNAGAAGGDASARADLTSGAQHARAHASARGGHGSFSYSGGGTLAGNARADAHLRLTAPEATGLAFAGANGGYSGGAGEGSAADAHAVVEGGTGVAHAYSRSVDILGAASVSASGAREATTHSDVNGPFTAGAYVIEADHVQATAARFPTFYGVEEFGYGMFSSGYGGTGESQTLEAYSTLEFYGSFAGIDAPAGSPVYLDLLSYKSVGDGFDSLTLDILWGGQTDGSGESFGRITETFTDLIGFQNFFESDPFLVNTLFSFQMNYSYTAHTEGSGFAFDYRLASAPSAAAPVPLPAGLPLMATVLAALGLLRRRKV